MRNEQPHPSCNAEGTALASSLAHARFNRFPVTRGHLLLFPHWHIAHWFGTTTEERQAILFSPMRPARCSSRSSRPMASIFGINVGAAASQTVGHAHVHLILRYRNEVVDPRGDVRDVIPDKQIS